MSDAAAVLLAEPTLAGRGRRLAATLLDAVLVPTLTLLLVLITGVVEDAEDFRDSAWIVHVLLLAVLAYLLLNGYGLWRRGQTLGKRCLGIAIVDARASRPDLPAPLWRLVLIRALFFPVLFLLPVPWLAWLPLLDQGLIFGRERRCLHDRLAGTRVVRTNVRST